MVLRVRMMPTGVGESARIRVNDQDVGTWALPSQHEGRWLEPAFSVPHDLVSGQELELELEGTLMLYHLWAIQDV